MNAVLDVIFSALVSMCIGTALFGLVRLLLLWRKAAPDGPHVTAWVPFDAAGAELDDDERAEFAGIVADLDDGCPCTDPGCDCPCRPIVPKEETP